MKKRFTDQVVWITGGGSGIGRALAMEFGKEGARVAVSGRRRDRLEEVVNELTSQGSTARAVPCDVTDEDSISGAVRAVVEELGGMDVTIANAGFGVAGRIDELSAADWPATGHQRGRPRSDRPPCTPASHEKRGPTGTHG